MGGVTPPHCRHEQTFVGKKGEGEEGKEERKEKEGEEEGKKKEKKKEKEKEGEEEGKKKEKKKEKEKKEKEEGGEEEEACRDVLIGGVRGATLIINVISKNVSAKNGLSAREKERRGEGEREEKSYGQVIKRT